MRVTERANTRYLEALTFAVERHGALEQARKGTDFPYVVHVIRVAEILHRFGYGEDVVLAGFLHDTIEDADVTDEELSAAFGPRVAELVAKASEDKSLAWRARKQHTIDGVRGETDEEALAVVAADKLHNVQSIGETVRVEGREAAFGRFNGGEDGTRWYYRGLAEALAERLPGDRLVLDLRTAVDDVFPA
jgi:(p)ppGpp synthase/HD superfamily hydrolase